jgi:acetyl-CoA carboxylase beta subunit
MYRSNNRRNHPLACYVRDIKYPSQEPLIGSAGPRVAETELHKDLPEGFQTENFVRAWILWTLLPKELKDKINLYIDLIKTMLDN